MKAMKPVAYPFCRDCKHCDAQTPVREHVRCVLAHEPVLGLHESCVVVRADRGKCGPRGVWFEARRND